MESRKVQKVGYSTLSISLPGRWVKTMNLKKGDLLFMSQDKSGSLRLFPSNLQPKERIEKYICNADLCTDPKLLERIIVGCYILGSDLMSIISSERISSENSDEVRNITRKLIGLGIVEATEDTITIQCSIDPTKFKLDMLLRRLSVISLSIVKDAMKALTNFDESIASDAIKREDEADTVYLLAMRLLIVAQRRREVAEEMGLTDCLQILNLGLILRYLEIIADNAEEIARRVTELLQKYQNKLSRSIIEKISNLNELAHDLVLKSVDCFFIHDIKIANSLLEILKFTEIERDRLMEELPIIPHLRSILWNINRIAENGARIALIAINNSIDKEKNNICSKHMLTT